MMGTRCQEHLSAPYHPCSSGLIIESLPPCLQVCAPKVGVAPNSESWTVAQLRAQRFKQAASARQLRAVIRQPASELTTLVAAAHPQEVFDHADDPPPAQAIAADVDCCAAAGWEGTFVCEADKHKAMDMYKEWKAAKGK